MNCNLSDLKALCAPKSCLLGLDPGRVIVGVAVSDPDWRVASPLAGLERGKFARFAEQVLRIVKERTIGGLIVGLPLNADGTMGPSAQAAKTLISNLRTKAGLDLPTVFWDERFSTAAVTRFMLADDMSRKRRLEVVDKAAAAYILQSALDSLPAPTMSPEA